jgi:flagellar biosynthesis/type III secretory pathway chaperone
VASVPVNACNHLLELLEEASGHYQALLSVLESEKKAIVESNLNELGKVLKTKEALLCEIRIIEQKRQMMTENLAESLGCSFHDLTITKLAELTEEPQTGRFKCLCSDLPPLAESIHSVNDINKTLLRHSVELIKSSFAFLNNLIAANDVYYRSGRVQQTIQSGKVLSGSV